MKEPGLQEKYAWERFKTPSWLFPGDPRMLYLGIDQHKRQLTVSLRAEGGTVILKRQGRKRGQNAFSVTYHTRNLKRGRR